MTGEAGVVAAAFLGLPAAVSRAGREARLVS